MAILTVYPDAGTGSGSVDGSADRAGVNETFATIRAGNGTTANDTNSVDACAQLWASATSSRFQAMVRSIFNFDTSPLGGGIVNSAVLSLYGIGGLQQLGANDLNITKATPASTNAVVASDFQTMLNVLFASITRAAWSNSSYNDMILNASGEANIDTSGVSTFASRLAWDRSGSFGGSWSSGNRTDFSIYFADQAGTTNDPKLTVTYEPVTFIPKVIFF